MATCSITCCFSNMAEPWVFLLQLVIICPFSVLGYIRVKSSHSGGYLKSKGNHKYRWVQWICGTAMLEWIGVTTLSQLLLTPPQTSNGHVNHLGGEGWNGFDTFVNVIHQQNRWRAILMWTKVLHFKIENTTIKEAMERESSKECSVSFLWTNESFSLHGGSENSSNQGSAVPEDT